MVIRFDAITLFPEMFAAVTRYGITRRALESGLWRLDHAGVIELSRERALTLLCGRYEGVDERLLARRVDEEWSLGDFVLSGGELAAMALIDAVVRQLPGALGDRDSALEESFVKGLLDCPHYTRPETYAGARVPEVLLGGNHERIRRWRLKQALGRTWRKRPELLAAYKMSDDECRLLEEFQRETTNGARP
jgi:tRNA (guanine37-N1)-methyltransferase